MRHFLAALALLSLPTLAGAQTGSCPAALDLAINPAWVCATPASVAEHNVPATPLNAASIDHYEILFFAPGVDSATGAPVQTIAIGKPTLNPQGAFWLQRAELGAIPVGQVYRGRLVAVNPMGQVSPRSPESNPFGRPSVGLPAAPTAMRILP